MSKTVEKFRGRFIVLDGPDGSGKSTQLRLLGDCLQNQGLTVCRTRDPGGTAIGDKIRHILLDNNHAGMAVMTETMLFMASRAQLVHEIIRPALGRGECVLCDRYVSSTIAYQGAGGTSLEDIRRAADIAVTGCWPDLTIILDLPADEGLRRIPSAPDRMESKDGGFHQRVQELFLQQAADCPSRFTVVSASGSQEDVHQRLVQALDKWDFPR